MRSTRFFPLLGLALVAACSSTYAPTNGGGSPTVIAATFLSAGDSASIAPDVDAFRTALGGSLHPPAAPADDSGRREVNWDGVPPALTNVDTFPGDFFNVNSTRGLLMVAPGNPLRLHSLQQVVQTQARYVNRPLGTGTRVLLDELLEDMGQPPESLNGYTHSQPSHAAVAQAVANGQADVGLGSESAARAAGLGFAPLLLERYQLVCLKSELDSPAVLALRQLLAAPAWAQTLTRLPGYTPDASGAIQAMNRLLPWWAFR